MAQVALQRHSKLRQAQQQLIYDVLAVCTGIRPGVMIDYVRMTKQQLQQLLQALLPHSHEAGVWTITCAAAGLYMRNANAGFRS